MDCVRNILESTSNIESKRLTPSLLRGCFVLILFLPLLLTSSLSAPGSSISQILQIMFYMISLLGLLVLVSFVTLDFVGARKSGFTSLVALTGISPLQWCLVKSAEMWRMFLMVWIVRLPILAWLATQGGLNWGNAICLECLYLSLFAWLSALGLLLVSGHHVKGISFGLVTGVYFLWEAICHLGLLCNAIASYYGMQLSASFAHTVQLLVHMSVLRKVLGLLSGGLAQYDLLIQMGMFLCFAGYCLWRYSRAIFSEIGSTSLGINGETAAETPAKPKQMPRCWSDALAWQACYYHQNGNKTIYGRAFAYIVIIALVLGMNFYGLSVVDYGTFLFAGSGLVLGTMMAAMTSLTQEVKDQTLPSLTMACGDPVELYQGWQRSWRRMGIPDLVFLPVLFASVTWSSPMIAYFIGTGIMGVACLGPLIFISPFLASWTRENLILSAKLFLAIVLTAGTGALVGWLLSWWLLPIVVLPLLYTIGQRVLHRSLPNFFDPLLGPRK